ncbi:MAG: hypothetical protein SGPRY_012842, partial [Prymnesium sp.]
LQRTHATESFSYDDDLSDPSVLQRLGKGTGCGKARVRDVIRWEGHTQLTIEFPEWVVGGAVRADLGPSVKNIEGCSWHVFDVKLTRGSLDGGLSQSLLSFRMGAKPPPHAREEASTVPVQCTLQGPEIEDAIFSDKRMASHITYPGSSCASHISPPPPSSRTPPMDDVAWEALRAAQGNWENCLLDDVK